MEPCDGTARCPECDRRDEPGAIALFKIGRQGFPRDIDVIFFNGPFNVPPHDITAVLDHVGDQSGLTWFEEIRKVHHLFIESSLGTGSAPAKIPRDSH